MTPLPNQGPMGGGTMNEAMVAVWCELELTPEERKRAETHCPYCRSKIIPHWQSHGGSRPAHFYECGTGHMGYPKGAKCKTIQLARELADTEFRHHLIKAVNESCSCGGRPITDRKTPCQACEVWHRFVQNTEGKR